MARRYSQLALLFLLVGLQFSVYGQGLASITNYSTADGLSDNRVTCIYRDKSGFMWFGSWAGLNRFDGKNFLNFKSYPGDNSSIETNRIDEIAEDFENRYLWVKTYDNQVYCFDQKTHQFIPLREFIVQDFPADIEFKTIISVGKNQLWLRTSKDGIFWIDYSGSAKKSNLQNKSRLLIASNTTFIRKDRFGNAWIGTDAGIAKTRRLANGDIETRLLKELGKEKFLGISEGKDGFWLATANGTVIFTSFDVNRIIRYQIPGSGINYMLVSKVNGNVYCTTNSGSLYTISSKGTVEEKFKSTAPIYTMFEQSSGALWIESDSHGEILYSPKANVVSYPFSKVKQHFTPWRPTYNFIEGKNNIVWTNALGDLRYYDQQSKKMEVFKIKGAPSRQKFVRRMFLDPDGVLWFGSGTQGIEKLVLQEQNFYNIAPSTERSLKNLENDVRGMMVDSKNRVWIGTKSGGVHVYADIQRSKQLFRHEFKNSGGIYSILEDSKGRIWLGTKAGGIILGRPTANNEYEFEKFSFASNIAGSNSIYCIFEDSRQRLWIASFGNGLVQIVDKAGEISFKTLQNSFKLYPKGFHKIRCIAENKAGQIWLGTTNGLLIFDPNEVTAERYSFNVIKKIPNDIESLGGNDVQFIYRDAAQKMWVLTSTGGLNLTIGDGRKNLRFKNYSKKDGLPSDVLLSCLEDKHKNLWVATQNGISKFYPDKQKFQNFNYSDGLENVNYSEASAAKTKRGDFVFGTATGVLLFDPETVKTRKVNAKLALTGLQINSEQMTPSQNGTPLKFDVNETKSVRLDYDQNVVSIDFAVLDFHQSERLGYQFRLVGFDDVWRSTEGQNRATFTKLPPGTYIFEVRSLNDEFFLEQPFRSLQITISSPPWRSWWAYTIYFLLLSLAVYFVRKIAMTMFRLKQGIEVEKKVAELKLRFFTQVSHELRTPLTLVINPSEEVLSQEKLSEKGKEYMTVVVKNTRRMLRMVNQLLDLRKLQGGGGKVFPQITEIVPFVKSQVDYFNANLAQRNISVHISSENAELKAAVDREKLEIALFNVLANAIKFSPGDSSIYVQINLKSADIFHIVVEDQGPGVNTDELDEIFKLYYEGKQHQANRSKGTGIGLNLTKELIELHGGRIWAEHNMPRGLRVIIELGLGNVTSSLIDNGQVNYLSEINVRKSSGDILPVAHGLAEDTETPYKTILLVEDNDELRGFLSAKFETSYKVITAKDGEEGLLKVSTMYPDLVLSDIMMPKMSGIELLDRLKNEPTTSHIPVILLTAKYAVESQVEALNHGADYYITKPFDLQLLEAAMAKVLRNRQQAFQELQKDEATQPEEATKVLTAYDQKFLEQVLKIVEDKLDDSTFNLDEAADLMGMSRSSFYRKFKSLTGFAPVEFVRDTRVKKGKEILDAGENNISVVAYAVGFSTPKYFSICFKALYGKTPTDYLKSIR